SFTRSDALAKHMRTVHETEALRPSDPVPKSHQPPPSKPQRLKLRPPKESQSHREDGDLDEDVTVYGSTDIDSSGFEPYPLNIGLSEEELAMPPQQLYRLLRRQLHWSEDDRDE